MQYATFHHVLFSGSVAREISTMLNFEKIAPRSNVASEVANTGPAHGSPPHLVEVLVSIPGSLSNSKPH